MKKLIAIFISATLVFSFAACSKEPDEPFVESQSASESVSIPDPSTPEGAISEVLQGAKEWDIPAVDARLPDGSSIGGTIPPALEGTLTAILGRMQYKTGRSTVVGDNATVEVEITAVDAKGALNNAATSAIASIAKQQLTGKEVDYAKVVEDTLGSIEVSKLSTSTSTATAYMFKDAGGEWKLDPSDDRNMELLNAASGGAIEFAGKLQGIAETYGIPLSGL